MKEEVDVEHLLEESREGWEPGRRARLKGTLEQREESLNRLVKPDPREGVTPIRVEPRAKLVPATGTSLLVMGKT